MPIFIKNQICYYNLAIFTNICVFYSEIPYNYLLQVEMLFPVWNIYFRNQLQEDLLLRGYAEYSFYYELNL